MKAGEGVLDLPWLCPGVRALLALARGDAGRAWEAVRADPGAVLLVLRGSRALADPAEPFSPSLLLDPSLLEAALGLLRDHPHCGYVDWSIEPARGVRAAALVYARLAAALAEKSGRCEPEYAWVGGLLAPLGWLGLCAAVPEAVAACRADEGHGRQPLRVEREHWGCDQAGLARRLARRWELPEWICAVAGDLGLPETVRGPGQEGPGGEVFAVVQAAVALSSPRVGLAIPVPLSGPEALARLGLDEVPAVAGEEPDEGSLLPEQDPTDVALLPEVLGQAAENRRLRGDVTLGRLEREVDALHDALREARLGEAERLQARKLEALAEFAAGAGHEINNPLAVISGQAQFLLNKLRSPRARLLLEEAGGERAAAGEEGALVPGPGPAAVALESADAEAALRKIMEQAHRVHQILRELMQFARPPRPHPQTFDLREVVREAAGAMTEAAAAKRVRLATTVPDGPVLLRADPGQVRTAVVCLVRNAIEAAPADGWASIRVEQSGDGMVEVVVEDSGSGPPPAHREHLFDPFFSGRSAGRGRGMGLPTAWRLARQHGGDVRFVALPDGPTRFVLSLAGHPTPVPAAAG